MLDSEKLSPISSDLSPITDTDDFVGGSETKQKIVNLASPLKDWLKKWLVLKRKNLKNKKRETKK